MTLIRIIFAALSMTVAAGTLQSQDVAAVVVADPEPYAPIPAEGHTLDEYKWELRPLVIFADTPEDRNFERQMALLLEDLPALERRRVVILVDTDPEAMTDIRRDLRPRGFSLVLIGLDGRVQLRKPAPWDVREITRSIDKSFEE